MESNTKKILSDKNKKIIAIVVIAIAVIGIIVATIINNNRPIVKVQRMVSQNNTFDALKYMYYMEDRDTEVSAIYTWCAFKKFDELNNSWNGNEEHGLLLAYFKDLSEKDILSYYDIYGVKFNEMTEMLSSIKSLEITETYKNLYYERFERILNIIAQNRTDFTYEIQTIKFSELMKMIFSFENNEGYYSIAEHQFNKDDFSYESSSKRSNAMEWDVYKAYLQGAYYYGDYAFAVQSETHENPGRYEWVNGVFYDEPASTSYSTIINLYYKGKSVVEYENTKGSSSKGILDVDSLPEEIVTAYKKKANEDDFNDVKIPGGLYGFVNYPATILYIRINDMIHMDINK